MEKLNDSFKVVSGELMVSDPCYDGGDNLIKALLGVWKVETTISNEGNWGSRVAEVEAYHSNLSAPRQGWRLMDWHVSVDSAQAGMFDPSLYPEGDTGEYDSDDFYGKCCKITMSARQCGPIVEDGVALGFVSSTGFGDGGYPAYAILDDDGNAIALKIIYIGDDEDENENGLDWE